MEYAAGTTPQKSCPFFLKNVLYDPKKSCQKSVRIVRNFTQKLMIEGASIYVPINDYMVALGCVPKFSEMFLLSPSISMHNKWLCDLYKSVPYRLHSMLYSTLKLVLDYCLEMDAKLCKCCLFSSSTFLLLSKI